MLAAFAELVKPGGSIFLSTINRTPRAYLRAVVGAEYLLRLLPTGTHSYEKFIRPSELAAWGRAAGLALEDVSGLDYDPFTRTARLMGDARVNYLIQLRRPAAPPGRRNDDLQASSGVILFLLVLLPAIALLIGWLIGRRRAHALEIELATARAELASADELTRERALALDMALERLRSGFDSVAGDALRGNSEMFLQLAREMLGQQQQLALQSLSDRENRSSRCSRRFARPCRRPTSRSRASRRSARRASARCAARSRAWRSARLRCNARRATSSPRCGDRRCAGSGAR